MAKVVDRTAGSVSKGCFVFKGKKKVARPADYFKPQTKSPINYKRVEIFQNIWEEVNNIIQILQCEMNTKIFDDLLKFVESAHPNFLLDRSSEKEVAPPVVEIPTAALITGVNTPDHAVMFSNLLQSLKERVSPYAAVLRSKDCTQIKFMLNKTISQLMDKATVESDEEEGIIKACNMSSLVSWYSNRHDTHKVEHSPKKKKKRTKQVDSQSPSKCPPLVVVLEDLESFSPRVLQDFLIICSNYLLQLPLVLVFGIATTVTAVHRLLPNAVSSLLCMEKFQAPPSSEYLTQLINQVLLTNRFPFKLGSKVFQFLLDAFLYHDFSVLNFTRGFQFAMMDHYCSNTVSCLCCPLEDLDKQVKLMTHEDIDEIRQISSFMRFVEGQPVSKQPDLITNDKYTKRVITDLVHQIFSYNKCYYPVLQCLHILVSKLPRHPLGKQIRELYGVNLQMDIHKTEGYQEAMDLLRVLSRDELRDKLCCCFLSLSEISSSVPDLATVGDRIHDYISQLENISNQVEPEEEKESTEPSVLPIKTKLYELRQTLQDMGKKRKLSPYEKLRNTIIDSFDAVFRQYLVSPNSLSLSEIFYYNNVSVVKQHLSSSPRVAIQTALSNPHHYLQCPCCESEHGAIQSTMPDICIIYKLHLECGQLINLYDWLQAFVTVITTDEEDEESKEIDPLLQARFIRAVSELQFLGFVKPTKRKTDHVARLTWGGC